MPTTKNTLPTILTLTILLTTSLLIPVQNTQATTNTPPAPTEQQLHNLITHLDPDTQQHINHLLAISPGLYLTYSRSGRDNAFRRYLPIIPRFIKPNGFFYLAYIKYTGATAFTLTIKISRQTGIETVIDCLGGHRLLIAGIGYTRADRNLLGGQGWLIALSLTKPLLF